MVATFIVCLVLEDYTFTIDDLHLTGERCECELAGRHCKKVGRNSKLRFADRIAYYRVSFVGWFDIPDRRNSRT